MNRKLLIKNPIALLLSIALFAGMLGTGCAKRPGDESSIPESSQISSSDILSDEESIPESSSPESTSPVESALSEPDPSSADSSFAPSSPFDQSSSVMSSSVVSSSIASSSIISSIASSFPASSGSLSESISENGGKEPAPTEYLQQQFHIATWRAVHFGAEESKYRKIIKANIEAGITLIENAVLSRNDGLMAAMICEEEKVNFFISNITQDKGYTGMGDNVPPVDDALVRYIVNEMKDYKYLEGYYVWDEVPKTHFAQCREIIRLFNKHDPLKLAFSLIFPSYGTYRWQSTDGTIENSPYYKYVTSYIEEVDPAVLSMDYYALKSASTSLIRNDLWKDMGLFRKKSIETGKPFWWYFQAYDMADGTVGHMTREKLAVQMFSGLAYGVKALSYFQSLGSLTDEFGNKTTLFEGAKSLNREVKNIGDLLFDKQSEAIYHFGLSEKLNTDYFLDDVALSAYIISAPDDTIVSVFGDHTSSKYIMIVNKDYTKQVVGNLVLKQNKDVEEFNKATRSFSKLFDDAASIFISIKPGDCVVLRIR